ncbi:hypothetical protein A2U01_0057773 [Trifolium medium]|uniref:Uncharacterized protein n=1 Tax=Trifolium medium TaxID=97028 RepID=A0A392RL71_9FABA|nr:hypothetical protein [Trifolium medium]
MTLTAPSFTALALLSCIIHKVKIAEATSFMTKGFPSSNRSISGFKAFDFPISSLFESSADNVKRVAAAFARVSIVPHLNAFIRIGITIGVSATSFLLLS